MKIKCKRCGKSYEIPITENEIKKYREGNLLIQEAFPLVSPGDRELIISQICDSCWKEIFKEE